jgi:replicative DNA helicase
LTIPATHNFVANDICVHNTAFALCIASNIAKKEQLPVAVFSLEMSREQLTQRLLSSEAKIASNRLRSGRISQNEFEPLINAVSNLSELPIYIDDTANLSVLQMRSGLRRLVAQQKEPLGLVLLDYLQLMEGGGSDNRVQELSKMTRSLKGLARELNVPIIALSQLSRGVEQRTNKRPMLSDLRESGSIEQDADLVIMLYRDEYYNPDSSDRGIAEALIVKHRNGPVGVVKLIFNAELTKFESLAKPSGY